MQLFMLLWIAVLGVEYLHAETHILSNVSVSTLEGVSLYNYVTDMKAAGNGSTLLLLNEHALWRLDPNSKETTVIAGSTLGYSEGVGTAGLFESPQGLLVLTPNKVVVISDTLNHCVRGVNLVSRQTSHLAGTCQSEGFRDGLADQAQFHNPVGLLAHKSGILVADYNNHAVRLVEGGTVSTIVGRDTVRHPNYLMEMEGEVYVTTDSGLLKLNPESKSAELIAGSESTPGFSDGSLLSARFYYAEGLVSPAPGLLLIADYGNHRVRLVDLVDKKVSSICIGEDGDTDGSGDTCQLTYPWSMEILGKTIYLGQIDGKIRAMPLESFTDITPVRSSVDLNVKYAVDCDNLDPFSWAVINSSLLHHYTNLIYACEDCGLKEIVDPDITCQSDVLSVSWPTDITFSQEDFDFETDSWPLKRAVLVNKLMKVQEAHIELTGGYFIITDITQNPPVVSPTRGLDYLYVYPEVVSS